MIFPYLGFFSFLGFLRYPLIPPLLYCLFFLFVHSFDGDLACRDTLVDTLYKWRWKVKSSSIIRFHALRTRSPFILFSLSCYPHIALDIRSWNDLVEIMRPVARWMTKVRQMQERVDLVGLGIMVERVPGWDPGDGPVGIRALI